MSIDKLQLPAFLQEALFKKNLLYPQSKSNGSAVNKLKPAIDFLGGNSKNIVFLINNNHNKFLEEPHFKFLSALINACDITMDDIAVVNFANYTNISYHELVKEFSCKKVLGFGVASTDISLPFTIPFFQVQAFKEIQFIFCPSIEELHENNDGKKKLWVGIQNFFKISKQK